MLTDFIRDHLFTIAWFGLMTVVWFGWAQEDPPSHWRWKLGVGSLIGLAFTGVFGYSLATHWEQQSALDGGYGWFGLLVLVEVLAAGLGAVYLWRRQKSRWIAWWVALVVAAHFIPLAFILDDSSLILLGLLQGVALVLLLKPLGAQTWSTSRLVGPVMGVTMLIFSAVSAVLFVIAEGTPW